jgi:hypothetical protein
MGETMKPICVPCQRFFRMKKSGYYFVEGMPAPTANGERAPAGRAAPSLWQPYKVWAGDLWECPDCGAQIIAGTGQNAIAEHYEDGFAKLVSRFGADQLQVNDC